MSQSGIYSDLKMPWHYQRDGKLTGAPKQAQVILSDLCNQNCHFCAYRMDGYSSNQMFVGDSELARTGHNNPKRWMPTQRALDLMQELADAGVQAVQFTGGGEPTVHPEHEKIFERAEYLGLKRALVSNGISWSDTLIDKLTRFSWVRVSIDAGTPETYSKIRDTPAAFYEKAWGHVTRLAHAIRTPTPSECVLGVGFVVTPDNWLEIMQGVERASESGATYIRLSAMFSTAGPKPYESIYSAVKESIHIAKEKWQRPDFAVHDLFGDRLSDLEDGAPDYETCYYQHYNTFIGGDLNVYRCCVLAFNQRGLLGSVKGKSYGEFLSSKETQDKLTNFDARGCDRCQFNSKNRAMNYLRIDKPTHIEFP